MAATPDGVSVRDLSRAIGCGKGTVSKMLDTLEQRHYVRQDAVSGRFLLTWRLLAPAFGHADQAGMPRVFLPVLQELADETDELVQLAVVDGDQVLFVGKAEGGRAIAAPIVRESAVVGAVALSGPAYRLSLERLHALAPRVRGAAERLASIWPPHVNAKDFER